MVKFLYKVGRLWLCYDMNELDSLQWTRCLHKFTRTIFTLESSVRGPWQWHHTPTLMDGTSHSKNKLDCLAFHTYVLLDVGNKLEWRHIKRYMIWPNFGYISLNNIFTLVFNCLWYNQSILSIFGHDPPPTCSYISMSSDYFYLNNCLHRRLISHILHTPDSYLNNISPPSLWVAGSL